MQGIEEDIDPLTVALRSFVDANRDELVREDLATRRHVIQPLTIGAASSFHSRKRAYSAITKSMERAEEELRSICSRHSLDLWVALLRRLPLMIKDSERSESWTTYASAAAVKWGSWDEDSAATWEDSCRGMAFALTREDILDVARMAALGDTLAQLHSLARWIGKGATLRRDGNGPMYEASDEVRTAVELYENRRPENALIADEGVMAPEFLGGSDRIQRTPAFRLGRVAPPIDRLILSEPSQELAIRYFLKPLGSTFLKVPTPYDDALEDQFGLNAAAIHLVLEAVGSLVLNTIPAPDDPEVLLFRTPCSEPEFRRRLRFVAHLCRLGFIRIQRDRFESQIVAALVARGIENDEALATLERFMRAFCVGAGMRETIDIRAFQFLPFIYESPGGNVFMDFLLADDFVCWLLRRAKDWFASQHGDQFTLAVKRRIDSEVPNARVVSWKTRYSTKECDLLIRQGEVLYAIECKAFAKSRGFWLGEPTATNERVQRINRAAQQAEDVARAVEIAGVPDLPRTAIVEWILCLPTQEYLRPINKHGFLSDGIPRVCTPEELVRHLNGGAGKAN